MAGDDLKLNGGMEGRGYDGPPTEDDTTRQVGYGYYHPFDDSFEPDPDRGSLMDYVRIVLRKKWIVVGVFLAVVGIGLAYTSKKSPVYRSQATLEIQKLYPSSTSMNDMFALFGQFDLYFQTQVLALKNRNLAEEFLVRTNRLPRLQNQKGSEQRADAAASGASGSAVSPEQERSRSAAIDSVLGSIKVAPVQGTQLINVSMVGSDPRTVKEDLQKYIETYMDLSKEKRQQFAQSWKNLLQKELDETQKQLKKAEKELQEFTEKHGVLFANSNPNQMVSFLADAGQNFYRSVEKRLQLEAMKKANDTMVPQEGTDLYLQNLRSQLAQLKSEYSSMQAIYSPDYFKLVVLRGKIQSLERTVAELEQVNFSSSLEAAKKREAVAGHAYEKVKDEALKKSPLSAQYEILKKVLDANGQMYVALLQRYKQAAIDPAVMGHNVVMFSPPTMPVGPINHESSKVLGIIVFLGLACGFTVALVLDKLDNTVRTTQDLERTMKAPILGIVPKTAEGNSGNSAELTSAPVEFTPFILPMSQLADSIRVIESATESLLSLDGPAAVCVSSALPLEGKTFITVSLATAMASETRRVLVIDGDMRRPRIQKLFGKESPGPGLSDLAAGTYQNLEELVQESKVPGLFYLPAGSAPDNPVALLKSKRFAAIIEECKRSFDAVLVDAPPMTGMADATILARSADGLILVTKQGHTPLEVLKRTQESMQLGRVRLLGMVLNMVSREPGRYDYYNKYGYRYYQKKSA